MKRLFIAIAVLASMSAQAEGLIPDALVVHGASLHSKPRPSGKAWNEVNYGLAAVWNVGEDTSLQAGAYKDSVFKPTAYVLVNYMPIHLGDMQLGGFVGAKVSDKVMPVIGLSASYKHVVLRLAPAPQSRGFVTTIEVRF